MSRPTASLYGPVDRVLHRLAFHGIGSQLSIADLEDRLFARRLAAVEVGAPVFVTSLPRCGTTLLLEVLAAVGEFAAHRYSDMPFVLCPLIWSTAASRLRRQSALRERAHGDGVWIDVGSPESFEEVVWKAFWPEAYRGKTVSLWDPRQECADFAKWFASHMTKIVSLRKVSAGDVHRYLSKNNANVARVPLIERLFPDAHFVVPFRGAAAHVRSLMVQHQTLGELQRRDSFARQYMEYLGHYEFGDLLKPVEFPRRGVPDAGASGLGSSAFWFDYWYRAFSYLIELPRARIHFVDYDELCQRPRTSLRKLCDRLQSNWSERWEEAAGTVRLAVPGAMVQDGLLAPERVRNLERALRERASNAAT